VMVASQQLSRRLYRGRRFCSLRRFFLRACHDATSLSGDEIKFALSLRLAGESVGVSPRSTLTDRVHTRRQSAHDAYARLQVHSVLE
jgi:hypothetical protein